MTTNSQQGAATNTSNQHYDLVSVLYHSLESAQTYQTYIQDAQRDGNQELAQFFQQAQQEEVARSEKAKQLLSQRLSRG